MNLSQSPTKQVLPTTFLTRRNIHALSALVATLGLFPLGCSGEAPNDATSESASAYSGSLKFNPVSSYRVWDSRNNGNPNDGSVRRMRKNEQVTLCKLGLPGDAEAVMINLAAVNPTGGGWLAAYPGGWPGVSNLNYERSDISNAAVVPLGADRCIRVLNGDTGSNVHVLVDVTGYFAPGGYRIIPIQPKSVESPSLNANLVANIPGQGAARFSIRNGVGLQGGVGGVISGAVVTMDKSYASGWGFLSATPEIPGYGYQPSSSHMNYEGGPQTNTQFLVTNGGEYSVYSYANAHVKQTMSAYFVNDGPPNAGFTEIHSPTRVYDSRPWNAKLETHNFGFGLRVSDMRRIKLTGIGGIPAGRLGYPIAAVIANVTIADPTGSGKLSAGTGNAEISTISFDQAGGNKANLAIIPVDDTGYGTFALKGGSAHLIVDVVGTITGDSWLNGANESPQSSNGWGKWNCGYVSCSFYVKRGKTKDIARSTDTAAVLVDSLALSVATAPLGPFSTGAILALGGATSSLSIIAGEVANDNKCLKITFGLSATNGVGALSPFWLAGRDGPYCDN